MRRLPKSMIVRTRITKSLSGCRAGFCALMQALRMQSLSEGLLQPQRIFHKLLKAAETDTLHVKIAQLMEFRTPEHPVSGNSARFVP
jgi:hypothetical protein